MNTPPFPDPATTWNRRYDVDGLLFGTEPNAWLREHTSLWQPGQHVLCVADGEGRNGVWLAQRGLAVDAFDIAELRDYEDDVAEGTGHRDSRGISAPRAPSRSPRRAPCRWASRR